jgi:hypothetical protein
LFFSFYLPPTPSLERGEAFFINSSLEGGVEPKARRWVFIQTPLPNFVRTPLKGRVFTLQAPSFFKEGKGVVKCNK